MRSLARIADGVPQPGAYAAVAIKHILGPQATIPDEQDPAVADLRTLVTRLARALRTADPANALTEEALDYLKRTGMVGAAESDSFDVVWAETLAKEDATTKYLKTQL